MGKTNTAIMSPVMCAAMLLSACGGTVTSASTPAATQAAQMERATEETKESAQEAPAPAGDVVTIQIGFENTIEEPIGKTVEKWAELPAAESSGTMKLELFLSSSFGSKSKLIDQMIMGESTITIADDIFYAGCGVSGLGTLYGPFFFDNWGEVWKLIDSDWYQTECGKLADKSLTVLTSNWVYGECRLVTKTKVVTSADIKGGKTRLMNSQIYVEGFSALGVTMVPMALDDVYASLQDSTLDGVENSLSILHGQSFQEVSRNILMTGYTLNFIT